MKIFRALIFSTTAILVGVGCSHQAPPELVMARNAYQRASTGPAAQIRPDEVHKAHSALVAAERSFSDDPDNPAARDLAYIAERKAQLAEALAAGQAAENERAATKRAIDQKQAAIAQQTQQKLGETRQELGATKDQLARVRQDSQATQQQLMQEQQARAEAEAQAQQANDALTALQAKEEARGMVITLSGSVLFTSNESTLLPDAQTRLNQVADALLQSKDRTVIVEGHTDSRGSAALNQALSQRRGEAVRSYLVSRGYPPERIEAHGIGPDRPMADNRSAEGRANNRRVEIIVAPKTRVSTGP
jgi:outer membrane protein OmpA-like peptidoglycan-associated protein